MKYLIFFFGLMGLFPSAFFAQIDSANTETLRDVVISGFHISDSLMHAPAAIGTISAIDLKANNNTEIATSMNRISGVQMQSGSFSTNRISIRGIGGRTPYGTNKIRAFYGNIPLTSGDSETTIEDIDVENISGVEVIKGPLSSVYGSGLGGAILIKPMLSGTPGNSFRVSTTHGSFGTHKNSLAYGFDTNKGSLNISYHRLESDGWRENSAYQRDGVTLAGELLRSEKSNLTYFGNFTKMKAFIPSSVDQNTLENYPKSAAATWKAAKGYEGYDSYLAGLSYEFEIGSVKNATSVFFNHKNSDEPRPFDILQQNTNGYGARTQFTGKLLEKLTFLAGAEYFRDGFTSRNLENLYQENNGNGSLAGEKFAESKQRRQMINAFAQLRWQILKKLEFQGGLNVNKTSFELDDLLPDASAQHYDYDGFLAPNASVLYLPNRKITVYASVSRGFSMPAIEETLLPDGSINPDIKPETGINFEIGSRWQLLNRKLFVETAVYQMDISNLLVARRVGDDQYVGVNAGKSVHRGIEASVEYIGNFSSVVTIRPFANGSFGEYRFEEFIDGENDRSGNRIPGVPSAKFNAGVRFNYRNFYITSEFMYVEKMALNDGNSAYNPAFRTWNAKGGFDWNLSEKVALQTFLGMNNLTDEKYASMILPNAVTPVNGPARSYYPVNPLNYYFGFALKAHI